MGAAVKVAPRVGMTGSVGVEAGVFVRVAVGGGGVAVGMAAWVSASIVTTSETIVFCMSTALTVGVACGTPQAPLISVITSVGTSS